MLHEFTMLDKMANLDIIKVFAIKFRHYLGFCNYQIKFGSVIIWWTVSLTKKTCT